MDFQSDPQESKSIFLEEMVNRYSLFTKLRDVFLVRFDEDNAKKTNKALSEALWRDEQIANREQTFQDHLKSICKELEKNGCPIVNSKGPGQPRKAESPWKQAFKWLWETEFPKWREAQRVGALSPSKIDIDWREVCRQVLAEHQKQEITETSKHQLKP